MKIAGIARNFDASQPSLISTFFGNTVYHFILITDADVNLPTGSTTQVPIRLECFLRTPSFDGLRLEVDGEFDKFDSIIKAKIVNVKETGMTIRSVKRLGLWSAISSIFILYALPQVLNLVNLGLMIVSLVGDGEAPYIAVLVMQLFVYFLMAIYIFVAFLIVSRIAFPVIYEAFERFLRRFTEYRS